MSIQPPAHPIPSLTPVETLEKLAAEGRYASVLHDLPFNVSSPEWEWRFTLNGEPFGGSVAEIYAPGDDSGWATVYLNSVDKRTGKDLEVIHGNWSFERMPVAA